MNPKNLCIQKFLSLIFAGVAFAGSAWAYSHSYIPIPDTGSDIGICFILLCIHFLRNYIISASLQVFPL